MKRLTSLLIFSVTISWAQTQPPPVQVYEMVQKQRAEVLKNQPPEISDQTRKIRACLENVFRAQTAFHEKKKTYTSWMWRLSLDPIGKAACSKLKTRIENANDTEFLFKATAPNNEVWAVDQNNSARKVGLESTGSK